jgi:tetrahydrodipicolinate N-succinyltransferase
MAGRYLWATTHHLERAVLWSNARIDQKVVKALEGLRETAVRMQDDEKAAAARSEKPIRRAEGVLVRLGAEIERI